MTQTEIFELVFMLLLMLPALIVGILLPIVDIRYGNTYLFGAFFDRTLYREDHPIWFWLVELIQIAAAASMIWAIMPKVVGPLLDVLF